MIIIPSIDISCGKAVKRVKGKRGSGIEIGNALDVAKEIYDLGYEHLHIVDLDAAEGNGDNEEKISQISKLGFKWIQVGGGIRSIHKALRILKFSSAVIISTLPFTDPREFERILSTIGRENVLLSLDYDENHYIKIKGWNENTNIKIEEFLEKNKMDVKGFIFTYIANEGSMSGIDKKVKEYINYIEGLKEYAGGIGSIEDLIELKSVGFDYVIVGMSFYKGNLKGVKYV